MLQLLVRGALQGESPQGESSPRTSNHSGAQLHRDFVVPMPWINAVIGVGITISRRNETEKGLRDYGDKLDPDSKAKVEAAVGRVKEALKINNMDEIKSATEALTTVWHEAAGKMYQQTQSTAGAQTQGTTSQTGKQEGKKSGEGESVDADYEVVN